MTVQIPAARLPNIALPAIHGLPTIPFVGCAGGDGTAYIGQQFGNLPDLQAVLHIKALKKALAEQIYALIQGKLPDPLRPIPYASRAVQLTSEIVELTTAATTIIDRVTGEVNAAIAGVNGKIQELNSAMNEVLQVPEVARTAVQHAALDEFDACIAELNAQKSRLQSTIECIVS